MVGITSYNVDNDKKFRNALDKAIAAVTDLRFAMGEISRDIFKNTTKNFILKGTGKYPPLNPKYAAYKKRAAPGAPILVFSGALKDSVTGSGSADTILNIGQNTLVQGTNLPYAAAVQKGSKRGMPERKYLFIDEAQAGRIERILSMYVASKLEVLGDVS